MECLPAATCLNRHIAVLEIHLDHAVHLGHVDQYALRCRGEVATGIAHAPTPRDDRRASLEADTDQRLHFLQITGPDDGTHWRAHSEYIL